ncbi:MAG: hypothetical protein JNM18_18765, partial [Planctomycetaceae bacterium]|nr:hypothetical protein [Planctomycetaceae bacterium]
MKRRHLFEWEDQPWLPAVIRDYITDHLHHVMTRGKLFEPIVPVLADLLKTTNSRRIVDLCSGGGGPFPELAELLQQATGNSTEIVLTDRFPNLAAVERIARDGHGVATYRPEPIDAFDVPRELSGVRTVFTALHHFRPEQVRGLLADAVAKQQPFAAFEAIDRDLHSIVKIGLFNLVSGVLVTHRVGPVTLARALCTWVLPVAPLAYAWDGIVSCLRVYTADELRAMSAGLGQGNYTWEV